MFIWYWYNFERSCFFKAFVSVVYGVGLVYVLLSFEGVLLKKI